MLKKIYICTVNSVHHKKLAETLKEFKTIEILNMSKDDFIKSPKFDIIHYFAIATELFGGAPKIYDSIILKTQGRYNFPPYIVISPGFKVEDSLTDLEEIKLQIGIPLKKAMEFSNKVRENLVYAVHTEIILPESESNENYIDNLVKAFKDVLCENIKQTS